MTTNIEQAVTAILTRRSAVPAERSALICVTGIDGSGKGYLTEKIVAQLQQQGSHAVGINIDGWLNLPPQRFNPHHPAEHFYEHALRFETMFQQLILPLRKQRSIYLVADYAEETANEYRRHTYQFNDVDIIVLEGIYLLKRAFRVYYDCSIWVDCSFDTALERAIGRAQEGLPPAETIRAYETIYFPAQRIHFACDNPRAAADLILHNDPRLANDDRTA